MLASSALAQTNVRGAVDGTNDYRVKALRDEPVVAWDITTKYRDSSALAISGTVLVTGNTSGKGGTFAYDTRTGKVLWKVPGHMRGEPAVDATAAYAVNAVSKGLRLSKLDLRTGKVLWSVEGAELGSHDAAPLVSDGRVFLVGNGTGTVTAYDAGSGKQLWQLAGAKTCSPSLATAGGLVFFNGGVKGDSNTLTALDAATGGVVWSAQPATGARPECTTAAAISGGLVITRLDAQLFAFDAKTGAPRWKQAVRMTAESRQRTPQLSEPTITGGVVYTSTTTGVSGYKLDSGALVFELAHEMSAGSADIRMAAAGGVLYLQGNVELPRDRGRGSGYVYAIDLQTKAILWRFHASKPDNYSNRDGTWATRYLLPVDDGLYVENESRLVKLVAAKR